MCGIVGFARSQGLPLHAEQWLHAMSDAIVHRGPDAGGAWLDPEAGIALGHRRLAVIDLSTAGAQPMQSASGRYVIVYNGEIYNFRDLCSDIEASGRAPEWRGHSDTEVLLAAIDAWGIKGALQRATGMFAFALWDRRDRKLTLARDRMGEKPLYYGWQGEGAARTLLFGSDLAALTVHPSFEGVIEKAAVEYLLRFLYIPDPHSIYRGIAKLSPGAFLTIDPVTAEQKLDVYWNTVEVAAAARAEPFAGSPEEAVDALDQVLGQAVARQMVSDVPIGAFLSGGIDSSTVVALMQRAASRPVKTFSIGFSESEFDETVHARAVARHLGTDHTEMVLGPQDLLDVIPQLPTIYSEPLADSSQVPTYLVSRLAREQVTVSLSGDAGDEVFGGYNRHVFAHATWPAVARLPRTLRASAGRALLTIPPGVWDRSTGFLFRDRVKFVADKIRRAAEVISSETPAELYESLIAINPAAGDLMAKSSPGEGRMAIRSPAMQDWTASERVMALDTVEYLPGDILVKVDRAAMAVSLETRVPFLDPDVVRFAWSLPIDYKIRNGISKWPLRQLLYRAVPEKLVDRPKMGFAMPIGEWFRGPLRDWVEALLCREAVERTGLFSFDAVQSMWTQHLQRSRNNEYRLWPVLMAQAWLLHRLECSHVVRESRRDVIAV
jgi:asparagine synthase (glutamine-hydrolysing)